MVSFIYFCCMTCYSTLSYPSSSSLSFTFSECYLNCFRAHVKTVHVKKEQSATHYTDLTVIIANEVQGVLSKVKLKFVSGTVVFIFAEAA